MNKLRLKEIRWVDDVAWIGEFRIGSFVKLPGRKWRAYSLAGGMIDFSSPEIAKAWIKMQALRYVNFIVEVALDE